MFLSISWKPGAIGWMNLEGLEYQVKTDPLLLAIKTVKWSLEWTVK